MASMDFFGHQQRARTASKWLVLLFAAAVVTIIGLIYLVAIVTFTFADISDDPWRLDVLLAVVVGVVGIVTVAMLYKTNQLSQGGSTVATMLGGRRVDPSTDDLKERMLHNIVEEMAIASGIPVPEVYVMDRETGLNAFAAGWGTKDAAIAVTRGLLDQLDRDELQGVIAHEFSHIFHGDMRLNIRLMGVLFGIVCIATIGRIALYSMASGRSHRRSSSGGGGGGIIVFGLALMVIGWLGVFFARMIQAAVSRQREYLADSSAVQYTRNPKGIGMALAKIGGLGATLQNAHAQEASHLMFADGVKRMMGGAFATHPPVKERVARILPGFTRELAKTESMTAAVAQTELPAGASGFAGASGLAASDLLQSIGDPKPEHVAAARELLKELPLDLVAAAHDPTRAGPLALAMLIEQDTKLRDEQLQAMPNRDGTELQRAQMFVSSLAELKSNAVLALLEMAMPALRSLEAADRERLRSNARALAMADKSISPFEFALLKTLEKHIPGEVPSRLQPRGRPKALASHIPDAVVVLSVLARVGSNGDEAAATEAFAHGMEKLGIGATRQLLPANQSSVTALERSLDALETVSPFGKRNLLAACVAAASADDIVSPSEADLLRALAEIWDCPMPIARAQAAKPATS